MHTAGPPARAHLLPAPRPRRRRRAGRGAHRRLAVRRRRRPPRPRDRARARARASSTARCTSACSRSRTSVEVWPGHLGGSLCGSKGLDHRTSSTIGFELAHNHALDLRRRGRVRRQRGRHPRRPAAERRARRRPQPRPAGRGARRAGAAEPARGRGRDRRRRAARRRAHQRPVRRGAHPRRDQRLRLRHGLRDQGRQGRPGRRRADRRRRLRRLRARRRRPARLGRPAGPRLPRRRDDRVALGGAAREPARADRPRRARASGSTADDELVVLDVRDASEFASGHIPGAVHIPYGEIGERARRAPARAADRRGLQRRQALAASPPRSSSARASTA